MLKVKENMQIPVLSQGHTAWFACPHLLSAHQEWTQSPQKSGKPSLLDCSGAQA